MPILRETYCFCAAHRVPELAGRDQSLHGHTYTVTIEVDVLIPRGKGCAFDHGDLGLVADWVLGKIDHREINAIEGLATGTNEGVVAWLGVRFLAAFERTPSLVEWCDLVRVTLGQLSPDRGRRLTTHEVIWEPRAEDRAAAKRIEM